MWTNALKFIAMLFLKNKIQHYKGHFLNLLNSNLNTNLNDDSQQVNLKALKFEQFKLKLAAMAESRAAIFKQNFNHDVNRVVNSLLGFMFILMAALVSLLTALMWIFITAWNSPNRDFILGATMLVPIIIAVGVYLYIRHSWQKKPLLHQSIVQIENDWQVFRAGLDGTADISDEANR